MEWSKFNINDLTDDLYNLYYAALTEERRKKTDALKNVLDKKRTVAGELLAHKLAALHYGIAEEEIRIFSKNGKPYLENSDGFISISHSGDYTVCAVCDTPVGIDIEKMRPINLRAANRFTKAEQEYINGSRDPIDAFFDVWTTKEAYIKYTNEKIVSYAAVDLFTLPQKSQKILFDDYMVKIIY